MVDVNLSWTDNSDNEDGFYVYQSTTSSPVFPDDYTRINTLGSNTTSHTVTGLTGNKTYYFAVTAYNTGGESSETTDSVTTDGEVLTSTVTPTAASTGVKTADTLPGVRSPTALATANIQPTSVDLSWTAASHHYGYRVYYSTDGGDTWTQGSGELASSTTSYTLSGLDADTGYKAKVVAFNDTDIATDDHVDVGTLAVSGTKTARYSEIITV